jgi:hypothetical protein
MECPKIINRNNMETYIKYLQLIEKKKIMSGESPTNVIDRPRELERMVCLLTFVDNKMNIKHSNVSGCIIINNKFFICLLSHKWRMIGKKKWYKYHNGNTFYEKYIKK